MNISDINLVENFLNEMKENAKHELLIKNLRSSLYFESSICDTWRYYTSLPGFPMNECNGCVRKYLKYRGGDIYLTSLSNQQLDQIVINLRPNFSPHQEVNVFHSIFVELCDINKRFRMYDNIRRSYNCSCQTPTAVNKLEPPKVSGFSLSKFISYGSIYIIIYAVVKYFISRNANNIIDPLTSLMNGWIDYSYTTPNVSSSNQAKVETQAPVVIDLLKTPSVNAFHWKNIEIPNKTETDVVSNDTRPKSVEESKETKKDDLGMKKSFEIIMDTIGEPRDSEFAKNFSSEIQNIVDNVVNKEDGSLKIDLNVNENLYKASNLISNLISKCISTASASTSASEKPNENSFYTEEKLEKSDKIDGDAMKDLEELLE